MGGAGPSVLAPILGAGTPSSGSAPLPKKPPRITLFSRGGATRTLNRRFWRPVLYQLSYTLAFPFEREKARGEGITVQLESRPHS